MFIMIVANLAIILFLSAIIIGCYYSRWRYIHGLYKHNPHTASILHKIC